MIDLKLVRDDPDRVRASQRARGEAPDLVDATLAADERRRAAASRYDGLRAEQKVLGKQVAAGKNSAATGATAAPDDARHALLNRARELAAEVKDAESELSASDDVLRQAQLALSNVVEDGAPEGGEDDFVVLHEIGEPRTFDFAPRDHVELGEILGAIDIERASKVSGSRFYYLKGIGALLELALVNMAMRQAAENGFIPMLPPALVRPRAMEGTGFLGQAAENVFRLEADDFYLVGTAEVPLAAYHMDEILDARELPLRYAGFSPCFRREAGTYGKDTKGIIRVHQFDKVEMFTFCAPEDAYDEHRRLLGWERQFLDSLEVPYRVIDTAAGDLGSSAARKFDCEAWVPTQGKYREVTSTSNCTEFQARRLGIRLRDENGVRPAATLNGTLVAISRTIVAIFENHQQADGSVVVPQALRPFLGVDVIEPIARR